MGLNTPKTGLNSSFEFQMAGLPWVISATTVSSTATRYQTPKVTKSIIISNLDTASKSIRIGFTENGINGVIEDNYFIVQAGQTLTFDVRVKEFYVRADTFTENLDYSVYCSLTTIDSDMMPVLTGSLNNVTLWDGVG